MTTATITVLNSGQRRFLDAQTQRARVAAERAAEDALRALAVGEPSRPPYLSDVHNKLRLALREKARQLGDDTSRAGLPLTNLVRDVAYEQWHRLLFARFLEVNGLLRHPEYRDIPLSLEDCADLAPDLGEPDAWAVAARFASEILPGVFRLADPAVQVRFAAEHRNALERLLLEVPADMFTTEDALGWVYQFWQTAEKKRVNDSGARSAGLTCLPSHSCSPRTTWSASCWRTRSAHGGRSVTPSHRSSARGSTSAETRTALPPRARSMTGLSAPPMSLSWTPAAGPDISLSPCSGCSGACAPRRRDFPRPRRKMR